MVVMKKHAEPDPVTAPRFNRSRWAAFGAAVAVTVGAGGGFGLANAVQDSGERSTYIPISPCRLSDTRSTNQIGPRNTPIGADETYTVAARGAQGKCLTADLPDDATALVLNVTALGATSQSFLTFWPDGDRPEAASLNPSVGAPPIPNAVTTALASDGSFKLYNERGSVNVVIDVAGYYTDHNHDDRYYTKAQADAAVADALAPYYTSEQTDAAVDDALFRYGPRGNRATTYGPRDFRPPNIGPAAGKVNAVWTTGSLGAWIPSGSENSSMIAPVHLPVGAEIDGMIARVIDIVLGTAIDIDLRVNGTSVAFVATSGGDPDPQTISATPFSWVVIPGDVIEIEVSSRGDDWGDKETQLQLLSVLLVWNEPELPDL